MLEVLPNLLEEDSDEPEHEGEAFYNDLFHLKLFLVVVSDGPQPEKVAFWKGSVPLGKSDGWWNIFWNCTMERDSNPCSRKNQAMICRQ